MIFKDRQEAANKLYKIIKKDLSLQKKGLIVVSLLRGGVVLGAILAKKLSALHLPLAVTKIPAPYNEELAIGALCFEITYLDKNTVHLLSLNSGEIREQIKLAERKFIQYCSHFNLNERLYNKVKGKTVIVTDDGIATGATIKAALLFLRSKNPSKIILAVPVASSDTDLIGFDRPFILHRSPSFGAVSRFYRNFPQIEDEEVKKLLTQ